MLQAPSSDWDPAITSCPNLLRKEKFKAPVSHRLPRGSQLLAGHIFRGTISTQHTFVQNSLENNTK